MNGYCDDKVGVFLVRKHMSREFLLFTCAQKHLVDVKFVYRTCITIVSACNDNPNVQHKVGNGIVTPSSSSEYGLLDLGFLNCSFTKPFTP
jgi:hypothetical protein